MSSLLQRRAHLAEWKFAEAPTDAGVFEGYGSTFGNIDAGDDVMQRGCFAEAVQRRGARGIKLFYQHDPSEPIGVWEDVHEDDHGLYCRGRLLIDAVAKAREVYALMKAGALDGLSIGFRAISATRNAAGVRTVEKCDLREVSIVTFPMNEAAKIRSVKGEVPTEREFEQWLTQDAGFTRSQARQIISGGYKSLQRAMPGAGDGDASRGAIDWSAVSRGLDSLIHS